MRSPPYTFRKDEKIHLHDPAPAKRKPHFTPSSVPVLHGDPLWHQIPPQFRKERISHAKHLANFAAKGSPMPDTSPKTPANPISHQTRQIPQRTPTQRQTPPSGKIFTPSNVKQATTAGKRIPMALTASFAAANRRCR